MLAAAPYRSEDPLELVKLVLTMLAQDGKPIPSKLVDLFDDVILEATLLAQNPAQQGSIKHPESISLALEILNQAALADTLNELHVNGVAHKKATANRALSLMGLHPA